MDEQAHFTGIYCQECDEWFGEQQESSEIREGSKGIIETDQAVIQFDGNAEYAKMPILLGAVKQR